MPCNLPGEIVRATLSTADTSTTAQSVIVYDVNGAVRTIGANERLVITDIRIACAAASTIELFDDVNSDGAVGTAESLAGGLYGTNAGSSETFATPLVLRKGVTPKVKASAAGAVRVFIRGRIIQGDRYEF